MRAESAYGYVRRAVGSLGVLIVLALAVGAVADNAGKLEDSPQLAVAAAFASVSGTAVLIEDFDNEPSTALAPFQCRLPDGRGGCAPLTGLTLALSMLLAFNVSFWSHVRRVYASPRRRWRGKR